MWKLVRRVGRWIWRRREDVAEVVATQIVDELSEKRTVRTPDERKK
jgi:hypothetical protein